jgi:hypothetical protein
MKKNNCFLLAISSSIIIFCLFLTINVSAKKEASDDKIKTEDLIQNHLKSIGTNEARKSITSILAVGTSKTVYKIGGLVRLEGRIVLASQNEKNMIGMKFDNPDYQYELLGFDGDNFSVGYAKPGTRSTLGNFLLINQKTFKSGIMGGILSTGWELLNYNEKRGKLKYNGTKTIGGVELYRFDYNPKNGSDLDINLFFEKSTFRHVRTEYSRMISAPMGKTIEESSKQSESRYKLIEQFGNFNEVNGLTLPHQYYIYLEILSAYGSTSSDWTIDLQQFSFNQPLEISQFQMNEYK